MIYQDVWRSIVMTIHTSHPSLIVKQLVDRETCTYTYLLIDPITQEAALIDAVKEQFGRDIQIIEELGVELLYTIETHVHADHVTSSGMIRQNTGAKIVFGDAADIKTIDIAVKDGQQLPLGNYTIQAISTPGHTSGCMSFYVDGVVFTGDALFIRGCGRTDFQQGDSAKLYDSITEKLFSLPDETKVYPAHDYNGRLESTIGEEKHWNPRAGQGNSKEQFIHIMNNLNLAIPNKINEAIPENTNCGISFNPDYYLHQDFTMNELYKVWQQNNADKLIIDSRTPEEFSQGHIPKCRNIPLGTEEQHFEELRHYESVYLYCRSGRRAQTALTNLTIMGLDNLTCISHSGMQQWIDAGYPVEN